MRAWIFLTNLTTCEIAIILIAIVVCGFLFWLFIKRWSDETEFNLNLLGIVRLKIRNTSETYQIAHKTWVEMMTRKVSLPFNEEHDVILEVYDSWFQMFSETRNLIGEISAKRLKKDSDTKKLIDILIKLLNLGMRPHLTKWQARLRHWTEENREKHLGSTPQEIQKKFPEYDELIKDLKKTNELLVDFSNQLREFLGYQSDGKP